jgi:MerR family transcriptional regulator, heat shock protein HspR
MAAQDIPRPESDDERAVYAISVAAELVGMRIQNLRLYEARGLVTPARTEGGTRRYSARDLERLRRIGDLLDEGVNLAGIALVLHLELENARLRARNTGNSRHHPAASRPDNRPTSPSTGR